MTVVVIPIINTSISNMYLGSAATSGQRVLQRPPPGKFSCGPSGAGHRQLAELPGCGGMYHRGETSWPRKRYPPVVGGKDFQNSCAGADSSLPPVRSTCAVTRTLESSLPPGRRMSGAFTGTGARTMGLQPAAGPRSIPWSSPNQVELPPKRSPSRGVGYVKTTTP